MKVPRDVVGKKNQQNEKQSLREKTLLCHIVKQQVDSSKYEINSEDQACQELLSLGSNYVYFARTSMYKSSLKVDLVRSDYRDHKRNFQ